MNRTIGVALFVFTFIYSEVGAASTDMALIARKIRAIAGKTAALSIRRVETGKLIFEHKGNEKLNPASNIKIITGLAALHFLGPAYRFKTEVFALNPPVRGILKGPIYFKGYGDPSLVEERVWLIIKKLKQLGIKVIEGPVVIDNYYFDDLSRNNNGIEYSSKPYNAETNAFSVNFNSLRFLVWPGKRTGQKPSIQPDNPDFPIKIINKGRTVASEGQVQEHPLEIIRVNEAENTFQVIGRVPLGNRPHYIYVNITDTNAFAYSLITQMLALEKIELKKTGVISASVPDNAVFLYQSYSKSLDNIVRDMNKFSSNFIADQLTKTLGALENGEIGTFAGGIKVIERYLDHLGVNPQTVHLNSGSGLSIFNKITTNVLTNILTKSWHTFKTGFEFTSSLSISGLDGTTKDRFRLAKAKRRFRVKTGLLKGVTALSGYVEGQKNKVFAFSLIANGSKIAAWKMQDQIDELAFCLLDLE